MITVTCDACKKTIPNAVKDKNYTTILDKNLCLPCKEELENSVSGQMAKKPRYLLKEYKKILAQTLNKMCS
ncbi:MAG: hypothetical protein J7K04_00350 [Spirochaetales bacterium]|nr:hypothetical protein [Spirochaetales bacterium]RKX86210.1 MAG: hypothetical protein DRP57_02035 [Spirochaetota bacterium]